MKKNLVVMSLSAMALFFNACSTEYVATEPTYAAVERPIRPSDTHIWVDGDWMWNRQSNAYAYRQGYWIVPQHGRAFIPGQWRRSRRGAYWSNGYWH